MMQKQIKENLNRHERRALGSSKKGGRRIGTMELASLLRCHPASIPRLVKEGRLPTPRKTLNKNDWGEDEILDLIEAGI